MSFSPLSGPVSTPGLTIVFSVPVASATLVAQTSWVAGEADATTPGGTFHYMQGAATLDATGMTLTFVPTSGFTANHEVRFFLTTDVQDTNGDALTQGSASAALSFQGGFPNEIFEGRFMPGAPASTPPATTTTTTPSTTSNPGPTLAPTTPPPGPSVPGAFEIVRTTPGASSSFTVPTSIWIEFSNPVNTATVSIGNTLEMFQAQPGVSPQSSIDIPSFTTAWDQNNTRLQIIPDPLFKAGPDLFVLFSSSITDASGNALTQGAVSGPLTMQMWITGEVFELRFTPTPVPTPALGGDPTIYNVFAGTDNWKVDFDYRAAQFSSDMQGHGLLSGDTTTDTLVKNRIEVGVLATVALDYGLTFDGQSQPGAWKISFTSQALPGTAGTDYSRECVGGPAPQQGLLGLSILDLGNQHEDDNNQPGYGIFSGSISGDNSVLSPSLTVADLPYVNGTYTLGSGSASQDARMKLILAVIDDWGRSLGHVTAHEIGHSVGLQHVPGQLSIMNAACTSSQLSDPRMCFDPTNAAVLDANLGKQ
jgi:hypothetical protein